MFWPCLLAAFLLTIPPGVYATRMIDGPLGTWLQKEASVKLGDVLTNHPRFKGERIKITGIRDGQLVAASNQLTRHIKEQLTHDLLATASVKIAFDGENQCTPMRVNTILGIEVTRHNAQEHRVTLAMVDREEGIWLNGTSLSWSGRLTSKQRRELSTTTETHRFQDLFNSQQTREIADALYDQLRCQANFAAPVYFAPVEDATSSSVSRRLRERFSTQSQVTVNKQAAASIIYLKYPQTPGSIRELSLELATADDPLNTHRIAEVAVTHTPMTFDNTTHDPGNAELEPAIAQGQRRYLSAIHYQESRSRKGACKHQARGCVQVDFDLSKPAYVVMFSTPGGTPHPPGCEAPGLRQPGKHQFRIKVPMGEVPNRPTNGFYALAFRDRSIARAVHGELMRGSANCNNNPVQVDEWASSFSRILKHYRDQTEWSALHFSRDANGVMTL
jgi:hypothetical protein